MSTWQPLRTRTTTTTFDAFGNPDLVVSATTGGRKLTEDPTYGNDTAAWLIGLVTKQVTTGCDVDDVCTARATTFTYYPTGDLKEGVRDAPCAGHVGLHRAAHT